MLDRIEQGLHVTFRNHIRDGIERYFDEVALPVGGADPACTRRFAAHEDDARTGIERRNEFAAQPGIREPEDLVVVECEHDASGAGREVRRCGFDVTERLAEQFPECVE